MADKIKLEEFPETPFDLPYIGNNITRKDVAEITKTWNEAQMANFAAKFPHFVASAKSEPAKIEPKDK